MGAWAPQDPYTEGDFKVPNCLLVIKCPVEVGCGLWQGKVSNRQWCPPSLGNGLGATSRFQSGGDFLGFWCFLGGCWSSSAGREERQRQEPAAEMGRASGMQHCGGAQRPR